MDKLSIKANSSSASSNDRQTQANRPRLSSDVLLSGAREVIIEHAGDEYRLRLTNQNKLILTK